MKTKNSMLQYLIIMFWITVTVGIVITIYIAYDYDTPSYSAAEWVETLASLICCYFVLPAATGLFLFKGIHSSRNMIFEKEKQRIERLPLYTVFSLIPGYLVWHLVLCLPDTQALYPDIDPVLRLNIFLILSYINLVIPLFIAYMLVSNIRKRLKKELYYNRGILFDPGKTKLWQKLFLMVMLISVFPVLILYVDGYVNFDHSLGENRRMLSNIDLGLVVLSIVISMVIVTKDITDPVNTLINSLKVIRNGDFTRRTAVTAQNEMGILTHNFNLMADGLEDREKIKDVFGQYVSPAIAEKILHKMDAVEGEERIVTVLFTDIKGYTSLSEKLSPSENVALLNEYYEVLIDIVNCYGGTVNKFMGDAIMVLFNAPLDDPKHALNAVKCGQRIIEETNRRLFGKGIKLFTRIGINTGPVIAGRLGGKDRFEYTIIGDTVNTAQRLEQLNKATGTQILISQNSADIIQYSLSEEERKRTGLRKIGKAAVKGKTERIPVYSLSLPMVSSTSRQDS